MCVYEKKMWEVFLSPDVQEFLDKQDKLVAEKIRKIIQKLKCDNPFHFIEHLEDKQYYKFRT